jgi:hypothetical protein
LNVLGHIGGIAFTDSEKAETLAESLEAQFQRVNKPPVIKAVYRMRANSFAPANELNLTNPAEV